MSGAYRMVDANGRAFDAEIPAFSLDCPAERRVLN
jgi:ApaG protein